MSHLGKDEALSHAAEFIRAVLLDAHEPDVVPILHLELLDGVHYVLQLRCDDRSDWRLMVGQVKAQYAGKVRAYLFICGAWAFIAETRDEAMHTALEWSDLSSHPDRVEVVQAIYCASDGQRCRRSWLMTRDSEGRVTDLAEDEVMDVEQGAELFDFCWEDLLARKECDGSRQA